MKLSARNVLKGTVVKVTQGAVNSEVVLELAPGIQVVAIITRQSAESLGLAEGVHGVRGRQSQQRDDGGGLSE